MLLGLGHDCRTADDANLAAEDDGKLSVYADDKSAVLVTNDRAFSQAVRRRAVGQHLQLRCGPYDAPSVLETCV
jgi:hypothetical protein